MLLIKVSGHIREEGPVVPPCIVIWLIFENIVNVMGTKTLNISWSTKSWITYINARMSDAAHSIIRKMSKLCLTVDG